VTDAPVLDAPVPDDVLARELEPVAERELARHLATVRDWYPHEYVPWTQGEDFGGPLDGREWSPTEQRFSDAARTSLIVNLLTEDNLPSYHTAIATNVSRDGAWAAWLGRWTAEEGRHGTAIRDLLLTMRAVDPRALEDARMVHMQEGFTAINPGLLAGLTYVSFQELATRVSHRNTGAATGDEIAEQLLTRIALDENLHMLFYRNVIEAAFDLVPDQTMAATWASIRDFSMPGHGIEGFGRKSVEIAVAGIYDLRLHRDDVVMPVLRKWRVFEREDLGPVGQAARDELAAFLDQMETQASRFEDKREALRERLASRG
jgi:acyl-[acyl-carrier-protein] desaturase